MEARHHCIRTRYMVIHCHRGSPPLHRTGCMVIHSAWRLSTIASELDTWSFIYHRGAPPLHRTGCMVIHSSRRLSTIASDYHCIRTGCMVIHSSRRLSTIASDYHCIRTGCMVIYHEVLHHCIRTGYMVIHSARRLSTIASDHHCIRTVCIVIHSPWTLSTIASELAVWSSFIMKWLHSSLLLQLLLVLSCLR